MRRLRVVPNRHLMAWEMDMFLADHPLGKTFPAQARATTEGLEVWWVTPEWVSRVRGRRFDQLEIHEEAQVSPADMRFLNVLVMA